MTAKGSQWQNNLIRKIKTLQNKVLCIPDEDYYVMLEDRYGKDSTTKLTLPQLKDLAAHLESRANGSGSSTPMPDGQARKIWQLWKALHEAGAVRNSSEKALNAFVKRQTGVESYRWLNTHQASNVIEALKKWQKRVRVA